MQLAGLLIDNDNIYFSVTNSFVKASAPGSNSAPVIYEGIILFKLDKKLNIEYSVSIPRELGQSFSGGNVVEKLINNNLYLFANHNSNGRFIMTKIDTKDGNVKNLEIVTPSNRDRADFSNLGSVIFSDDSSFVVPVSNPIIRLADYKFDVSLYRFHL